MTSVVGQPESEKTAAHVRSLVLRGTQFVVAGQLVSHGLRLVSNVVLARLLFPEAFGLMALIAVFMQGLQMFSDVGIQTSIVQNARGGDRAFLNTAWTLQVMRGVLLWISACVLAWPFASAYDEPRLLLLIPVAALSAVFSGFESTAIHSASRDMRLGPLTALDLLTQLATMGVTILAALHTPSVWALVFGSLTASLLRLVLSHVWIAKERNRFQLEPEARAALLTFGKWIFVSTALTFLVGQGDKLLLARLITLEMLGIYAIASSLALLPAEIMSRFSGSVVFPAYCRSIEPRERFPDRFASMRTPLASLALCAASLLCVVAPALIQLLYDARYQEAQWMVQILLVGVAFRMLENVNGAALLALGDSRMVALGSAAKLCAMAALMLAGYQLAGFVGAIAGYSLSEVARYAVSALSLRKYHLRVLRQDVLLLLRGLVTAAVSSGLCSMIGDVHYSAILKMVVAVVVTTVFWFPMVNRSVRAWRAAR